MLSQFLREALRQSNRGVYNLAESVHFEEWDVYLNSSADVFARRPIGQYKPELKANHRSVLAD